MTSKELKDGVSKTLGQFLLEEGYRKIRDGYQKVDGDFAHSIVYSHLIGDNNRPTSFAFWVQSRMVYVILKKAFEQKVDNGIFITLVALSQASTFNLKPKEFQIDNEDDILIMCNTVKEYLTKEGFGFFEGQKSYVEILNKMKSTTPPDNFYSLGFGQWVFNALILSRITYDLEYERLADKYIEFTRNQFGEGAFLRQLEQLNNYLISNSIDNLDNLA